MDLTLIEMAKQVRGKTLRLLNGVDDEMAHYTPAGLHNTILWHAGHALVVVENLAMVHPFGTHPAYPEGWFELFGWNSKPAEVKAWPSMSDVHAQLLSQRERLVNFLSEIDSSALDETVGEPPNQQPRRGVIVHGLHDEACHQGEIYLLRKLWKLRAK